MVLIFVEDVNLVAWIGVSSVEISSIPFVDYLPRYMAYSVVGEAIVNEDLCGFLDLLGCCRPRRAVSEGPTYVGGDG